MRRSIPALLLVVLVSALTAPSARAGAPPALQWRVCPPGSPAVRGTTIRCASIVVPVDRAAPAGATLRLRISRAVRNGSRIDPGRILLTLSGGPGQSGWWTPNSAFRRDVVPSGWTVVGVDQRGTGLSGLRCPSLQSQSLSDIRVPAAGTIEACGALLGPARASFRTADTLDDLEAVRTALGIARWGAVWGISYGSYVASRYARAFPGSVRAAVLQSVVPARTNVDPLQARNLRAIGPTIARICAAGGCRTVRTQAEARRLADRLARSRPRLAVLPGWGGRGRVRIDDVAYADAWISGSVTGDHLDLPAATRSALAGDLLPLARAVARARYGVVPATDYSWGLHMATLCADMPTPWGGPAVPVAGRASAVTAAITALPAGATGPFPPITAGRQATVEGCRRWPEIATAAQLVPAAPAGPAILIVQGDLDLSTPAVDASAEAADWPGVQRLSVRNAGHGWFHSSCAAPARAFIERLRASRATCGWAPRYIRAQFPRSLADARPLPGRVRGRAARVLLTIDRSIWEALDSFTLDGGRGLRGGSVRRVGGSALELSGYRFVSDVTLNGTIRNTYDVRLQRGLVTFHGAARGTVRLRGRVWTVTVDGRSYTITFGSRGTVRAPVGGAPGLTSAPEGIAAPA